MSSHELEQWWKRHGGDLAPKDITAVLGRGPGLPHQASATWMSLTAPHASGRIVLWGAGRCQLGITCTDHGGSRFDSDRTIATDSELDDALQVLVDHLSSPCPASFAAQR